MSISFLFLILEQLRTGSLIFGLLSSALLFALEGCRLFGAPPPAFPKGL